MRIDAQTHFPHPVLCEGNGDFREGQFDLEVSRVRETTDGRVEVDYQLRLTEGAMLRLFEAGTVKAGAFVRCQDTFYSALLPVDGTKGTWTFNGAVLYGKVEVKPVLWLAEALEEWSSPNMNEEFGDTVSIASSQVIGVAYDTIFSIGQDKLRKFESIFELVPSEEVEKGRMRVDLDSELIRIIVRPDLFSSIELMRGSHGGKDLLLSSVYLPVVMEVLDSLRDGSQPEDKSWYRTFTAKCEHLGVDIQNAPLLESAQRLLASPVERMSKSYMDLSEND